MTQNTSSVSAPTVAFLPPWVPLWETGTWADGNLRESCAPMSQWPWAFSHHQGIPIMLESKWTRLKDASGKTEGWHQDTSKIKNYHGDLRLTWDQVQKAVEISRRDDISLIKFHTAGVLQNVLDRAIQIHGALGMTDETPLAFWYRHERAARIYDGPDEVHKWSVARRILSRYA